MTYIFAKEGKQGLRAAITKKQVKGEKSSLLNSQDKKSTFALRDDFYSISFYSYILM
jgi:hypothetical protein